MQKFGLCIRDSYALDLATRLALDELKREKMNSQILIEKLKGRERLEGTLSSLDAKALKVEMEYLNAIEQKENIVKTLMDQSAFEKC